MAPQLSAMLRDLGGPNTQGVGWPRRRMVDDDALFFVPVHELLCELPQCLGSQALLDEAGQHCAVPSTVVCLNACATSLGNP